jgi:hypothetical protein
LPIALSESLLAFADHAIELRFEFLEEGGREDDGNSGVFAPEKTEAIANPIEYDAQRRRPPVSFHRVGKRTGNGRWSAMKLVHGEKSRQE